MKIQEPPHPRLPRVARALAVDPGDTYVGLSMWEGTRCVDSWETTPMDAIEVVRRELATGTLDALVVEIFELYPWKAKDQFWSRFGTSQLIGALRLEWCRATQNAFDYHEVEVKDGPIWWIEQKADIKKPARAQMKARKVKPVAKPSPNGPHASDAELHGFYFTMRNFR